MDLHQFTWSVTSGLFLLQPRGISFCNIFILMIYLRHTAFPVQQASQHFWYLSDCTVPSVKFGEGGRYGVGLFVRSWA